MCVELSRSLLPVSEKRNSEVAFQFHASLPMQPGCLCICFCIAPGVYLASLSVSIVIWLDAVHMPVCNSVSTQISLQGLKQASECCGSQHRQKSCYFPCPIYTRFAPRSVICRPS